MKIVLMFCFSTLLLLSSCGISPQYSENDDDGGSITITTNGLAKQVNDLLIITVSIHGPYALAIKRIINSQTVIFISGNGPAQHEFSLSSAMLVPGEYLAAVNDSTDNVIYHQNFDIIPYSEGNK